MSTEIELKLQISPQAARQLAQHPLLLAIPAQRQHLLNTYFDTPRLELHAKSMALRLRRKGWQWLCTVKTAPPASGGLAIRGEWEAPATPGEFDFSHVDNTDLRDFLEQRRPKLEPIFTTDFQRRSWQVNVGQSQLEVALDQGHIDSHGRRDKICEIEIELLSGQVADLFALARQLQQDIDLRPAIASKAERGYDLHLDAPRRPFKAKMAQIHAEQTPIQAFRNIAHNCLEHFQRNEAGLLANGEAEFIHQARVALRRLRSAIKLFSPVLPPEFVATYGQTWQTLAGALGEARNWDVFLEETLPPIEDAFPGHPDIKRLRRLAQQHARDARKAIPGLLAVGEYPRLLVEFTAAVHALDDAAAPDLKTFARDQLALYTRKARKLALRHAELTPEERHKMRIAFKKLRYALEFLAPLLPARRLKPRLAALGRLQDELGLINDHVTAETLLAEALSGKPAGPVHGWIAGRHALLVVDLPTILNAWLNQNAP